MTRRLKSDLVVIGAGPAGLEAAAVASAAGVSVTVLDNFAAPGGQYHMQPGGSDSRFCKASQVRQGVAAIRRVIDHGGAILSGAEVWGVFPGFSVHAQDGEGAIRLDAQTLLIATGAHDRTLAFPGWTLPGVMTPGAAQRLAKTSGIPPGKRTLLAGSGPFLLPVANAVLKVGGRLAEILEARHLDAGPLTLLLKHPEKWPEAARLLWPLIVHRPRFRFGEVVIEALGDERVEAARVAPLDAGGKPLPEQARLVENIDSLLVGYGFRPQIEMTSILGCEHRFDALSGEWCCVVGDETGATSVPGVFAAGEIVSVGGAVPARLSGKIAGLGIVEHLGGDATAEERRALVRQLGRARRFADALHRAFAPPQGLPGNLPDETLICRCEDVTVGELRREMVNGVDDVYGAKLWTRAGMGVCQGRICGWGIARFIAAETGTSVSDLGFNQPRIPLRPVPLRVVQASLENGYSGQADGVVS